MPGPPVQEHDSRSTAHPIPVGNELGTIDIDEEPDVVVHCDPHFNPLASSQRGTRRDPGLTLAKHAGSAKLGRVHGASISICNANPEPSGQLFDESGKEGETSCGFSVGRRARDAPPVGPDLCGKRAPVHRIHSTKVSGDYPGDLRKDGRHGTAGNDAAGRVRGRRPHPGRRHHGHGGDRPGRPLAGRHRLRRELRPDPRGGSLRYRTAEAEIHPARLPGGILHVDRHHRADGGLGGHRAQDARRAGRRPLRL